MSTCTNPPMTQLSERGGSLTLLLTLTFFGMVAAFGVPFMVKQQRRRAISGEGADGADFWHTARNTQGWPSLAFSICATSAGGWLLYTPAEAAVLGGWWALLGYCVAIALGPLFMAWVGPKLRAQSGDAGNITDWVLQRFGFVPFIYVTLFLLYYVFIYLVGQLKTMGDMSEMFTGLPPKSGIVPLAMMTLLYTMVGGFPASLVTDWIQSLCILFFVFGICIAVWGWVDVKQEDWEQVSVWSDRGFEMAVSLCFAVFGAEVFNLAFWQRIYAARDDRSLRIGFCVGAAMVSVLTFIFGITGMLLKAQDLGLPCPRNPIPPFVFFEVLNMEQTGDSMRVIIYMLVVCMIASNADSFQTAITSLVSRALRKKNWSVFKHLAAAWLFALLVNIPAIYFAIYAANDKNANFDGLAVKLTDLFSMADILTITLVVPVFAGLWPYTTPKGHVAGLLSGLLFIVVWGWVEFHTFMGGLEMITMMCFGNIQPPPSENGAPGCGFYSARAPLMFPMIVLITGVATCLVSFLDRSSQALVQIKDTLPQEKEKKPEEYAL